MSTPSMGQPNPYAPPKAEVQDIVAADSGELAGRFIRLVAYIVDLLIIGLAVGLPVGITAGFAAPSRGIGGGAGGSHVPFAMRDFFGLAGLIAFIALIVWIIVTIRFVHLHGQTIGKRILGIKVVRKNGSRASLGRIFWLRNIVNGLPGMIPFFGDLYLLADHLVIFGEARQCLHDKIADTIVVKA
jgi:uncharacterized RDD family membrane protein YckC